MGLLLIGATGSIGRGILPIVSPILAGVPYLVRWNIMQCVYLEWGYVSTFTLEDFFGGKSPEVRKVLSSLTDVLYLANPRPIIQTRLDTLTRYRVNFIELQSTISCINKNCKARIVNLLYASTGSLYSSTCPDLKKENSFVSADNLYEASKLVGEAICALENRCRTSMLRCTSLRIFHVFKDTQEKGFIYQLVNNIYNGQLITLEGEHGKSITPTSIQMVAHSFLDLVTYKGILPNVINICGDLQVTMRELSMKIASLCKFQLSGFEVIGKEEFVVGDNKLLKRLLRRETIDKYFNAPMSFDTCIRSTARVVHSEYGSACK